MQSKSGQKVLIHCEYWFKNIFVYVFIWKHSLYCWRSITYFFQNGKEKVVKRVTFVWRYFILFVSSAVYIVMFKIFIYSTCDKCVTLYLIVHAFFLFRDRKKNELRQRDFCTEAVYVTLLFIFIYFLEPRYVGMTNTHMCCLIVYCLIYCHKKKRDTSFGVINQIFNFQLSGKNREAQKQN